MNVLGLYLRLSSGGSPNGLTVDFEVKVLGSNPVLVLAGNGVGSCGKMLDTKVEVLSSYPIQGLGDNYSRLSGTVVDYRCKGSEFKSHLWLDIGGNSSAITLDARVEVLSSHPILGLR